MYKRGISPKSLTQGFLYGNKRLQYNAQFCSEYQNGTSTICYTVGLFLFSNQIWKRSKPVFQCIFYSRTIIIFASLSEHENLQSDNFQVLAPTSSNSKDSYARKSFRSQRLSILQKILQETISMLDLFMQYLSVSLSLYTQYFISTFQNCVQYI